MIQKHQTHKSTRTSKSSDNNNSSTVPKWQFWIDRGGTFTDVIGIDSQGELHSTKVLSNRPEQYKDAAIQGICELLKIDSQEQLLENSIEAVKMGTTVATNTLLEHKGEPTLLCITQGFADLLEIGYQTRPKLFDLNIQKPQQLYQSVIEAEERLNAKGEVILPLNIKKIEAKLIEYYERGIRSIAIAFIHAHENPSHEQQVAKIAEKIGYQQISVGHQTSAMLKLIARGDTTVADAYLSPILKNYINQVEEAISNSTQRPLLFMRSDGGLSQPKFFHGKDAILSGPAGGVVGMVKVCQQAGFDKIIGFDMGGTSTDVCHYYHDYERIGETNIAGVRLQTPMMKVHTVAAGGGSIIHFEDGRFVVGPDSAGADPGPACYGRDGPLTITDCNVLLGRINAEYFPKIFGKDHRQSLDVNIIKQKFQQLQKIINDDLESIQKQPMSVEDIAWGFLKIAVMNMANAIKKISIEEGYDIRDHVLCCFGGAAGQHACQIADELNIKTILIHPLSGLLSAFGIGLSGVSSIKEKTVDQPLNTYHYQSDYSQLYQAALAQLQQQGVVDEPNIKINLLLRYNTSETTLNVNVDDREVMQREFEKQHQQLFSFIQDETPIIVDRIQIELTEQNHQQPPIVSEASADFAQDTSKPSQTQVYYQNKWYSSSIIEGRNKIKPVADKVLMIIDKTGTNLIDPDWQVSKDEYHNLIIQKSTQQKQTLSQQASEQVDPILLEVFNNQFMSIAEQMGATLAKTAQSVNIRERLDFSCALFNSQGDLIANANHIPVHLGSMSDSVKYLIDDTSITLQSGDVYMLNDPFKGGTHLPDITVITPVFDGQENIIFYTASRGHHSDIGGTVPGSCPANSTRIHEEGVIISNFQIVKNNQFRHQEVLQLLSSGEYPCRNVTENIADIKAQIAANEKGSHALKNLIQKYGQTITLAYTQFVQNNAEQMVKDTLTDLHDGEFTYTLDNGNKICVAIGIDSAKQTATINFNGTSSQHNGNFNAPSSICHAAVLYVFRCLIDKNIPLNQGCLKPLNIIIPKGSFINPEYPAAVIAGNTEVSQAIVESLLGALGVLAGSQGTMNNFIYGNQQHQNYETICGGAGAGNGFHGASAVHTHMTNTRMTDPEVLERRYPVQIEEFSIRRNTAGKGKYHGGEGIKRKIRFKKPMQINVLSSNRNHQPHGIHGGQAGAKGENSIKTAAGKIIQLNGVDCYNANTDDTFIMLTPSGGGYGKLETD